MKRNLLLKVMFAAVLFLSAQFVNAQSQCDEQEQGLDKKCATSKTYEAGKLTIDIDGETDDWEFVKEDKIANTSSGADEGAKITGPSDLSGTIKACYDDENLYVLGYIFDDTVQEWAVKEDGTALGASHMFDNLEIFTNAAFDNDNLETGAYSGDANQIRINYGADTISSAGATIKQAHCKVIQTETTDGWLVEIAIKWAGILGEGVKLPDVIGFEVSVGDSDVEPAEGATEGTRESLLSWANDTGNDNAWQDTRCFGYLKLTGKEIVDPTIGVKAVDVKAMSINENPVKDILTIKNATGKLTISDVTGKVVMEVENSADVLNLNVAKLSKGVYFVNSANKAAIKFVKQ